MAEVAKRNAAEAALELVQDGMVLGLGTGSTAKYFVEGVGRLVASGMSLTCVPTSVQTENLAESCKIPFADLKHLDAIDLTVDGADEFDQELNLIKGGGAALLREKIVADFSEVMIIIADESKKVEELGKFPLPVEVNLFGLPLTIQRVRESLEFLGIEDPKVEIRQSETSTPLITDGGHHILDLHCNRIPDIDALAATLDVIPGVVEHGLFIELADAVIVGTESGTEIIERN